MSPLLLPLLVLLLAPPRLSLSILPRICQAPCTIRVQVRIPPSPANRWWVLVVDGPSYSSSINQLDGEQAPTTQPFKYFYGLSAGEYEVSVAVTDEGGKVLESVREWVEVD